MCDAQNSAAVGDFWIGVVASTVGSIILNLGINLQRYAHLKLEATAAANRTHYTRHPIWLIGFLIFAIGNGGDAVGLTFTPQSVITPIGSVSLVSNLLFARILLKETIGLPTYGGVVLIIGGVIVIVTTSVSRCTEETLDSLLLRWQRTRFVAFAVCHVSVLFFINVYVYRFERRMQRESEGTKRCLSDKECKRLRLAYALLASLYATWTVVLVKSLGELVKETFRGANQLTRWETYLLLLGAIVSMPSQIRYLNGGLRHFESLFIIPVFYVFWVFGSITMGGLYFDEFALFQAWNYGAFAAGVIINAIGVVILASRSVDTRDDHPAAAVGAPVDAPPELELEPPSSPKAVETPASSDSREHSVPEYSAPYRESETPSAISTDQITAVVVSELPAAAAAGSRSQRPSDAEGEDSDTSRSAAIKLAA